MLEDEEIKKIKELIDQGLKDYTIGKKLGHSPNTISKIRREYKDGKLCERSVDEENFGCLEEDLREFLSFMDARIQKRNMKAHTLEKWKKWMNDIQKMLRAEVDERIPAEITNAVNERDDQWNDTIQQKYVKKEIAEDFKNSIDAKDIQIEELIGENKTKDSILRLQHSELHKLKSEKTRLLNDNWRLNNDIQICHDTGELKEEKLTLERQIFEDGAKETNSDVETIKKKLIKDFKALCKEKEDVEKRKKNLTMREEEFDKKSKNILYVMDNKQELILKGKNELEKITEKQRVQRHRLHKWQKKLDKTGGFNKFSIKCPRCSQPKLFDVTDPEIYQKITNIFGNQVHPECDINNMQPTYVKLRPVSFSGEFVVRSGIPPIIKSGEEIEVYGPNGEPVA